MARARQCDLCKRFAFSEAPKDWTIVNIYALGGDSTPKISKELCGDCSFSVKYAAEHAPPQAEKSE